MSNYVTSLQPKSRHRNPLRASPRHTILLVEDDGICSLTVAEVLRKQGFRVIEVQNANEAVIMMLLLPIDAIDVLFTDIELPGGMNGLTLAQRAREILPDVKVVIGSGQIQNDNCPKIADACFSKPYDLLSLPGDIEHLLTHGHVSGAQRQLDSVTKAGATSAARSRSTASRAMSSLLADDMHSALA